MALENLKQARPPEQATDTATAATASRVLAEPQSGGEVTVRRFARELDGYSGDIVLGQRAEGSTQWFRRAHGLVGDAAQRQIQLADGLNPG